MNWTGGWSGPRRKRKPDGSYKDELPEAGILIIIIGGVAIFCVGGAIAVGALFYFFPPDYGHGYQTRLWMVSDEGVFSWVILLSFIAGGVFSLGGWFFTVWESRRKEARRKERERRLEQKWGAD